MRLIQEFFSADNGREISKPTMSLTGWTSITEMKKAWAGRSGYLFFETEIFEHNKANGSVTRIRLEE